MHPKWAGNKRAATAETGPRKDGRSGAKGSKDKDLERLEQIALTTGKLMLTVAKDVEDLKATCYECWELGAEKKMAMLAVEAGKEYDQDAKKLKESKAQDDNVDTSVLGPPHLVVAAKVVKGIADEVPEDQRKLLAEFWKQVVCQEDPEMFGTAVTHFQAKVNKQPNQKKEKVRLIFSFDLRGHSAIRDIIVQESKREGGIRRLGGAPRGPMQRELQRLVYPKNGKSSS